MLRLESVIKGDDFFSLIELRKQRGAEAIALKSQLDTTLSAYFSESSQLLAARINTMFTSARGARRLFPSAAELTSAAAQSSGKAISRRRFIDIDFKKSEDVESEYHSAAV